MSTPLGEASSFARAMALTQIYGQSDPEAFALLLGQSIAEPTDAANLIIGFVRLCNRVAEETDLDLSEWITRALPYILRAVEAEDGSAGSGYCPP